ncbi:MAG: T9SS type A sorting domain-containing protein, partial [Flavobacteriales bacterium]
IFHWNASYPERTVRTIDNNYVLIATSGGRPVLMKTNTSGDMLWTRAAKTPGYSYETADLLAYSDGGFLFSGIVLGDLPDGNTGLPYIYKTDSLGHLPCSEAPPPSISISELFPVDSAFTLTSTDGATAYAELVSDTTYAPVVTYDGCLLTSVRSPVGRAMNPRIHPNPSSGHFTMAFSDPLTVDSFYSVHDATGRLLFQRPLTKSLEKVEIDLSGYGKGMYLIRFSDRDGVCAERVVVE